MHEVHRGLVVRAQSRRFTVRIGDRSVHAVLPNRLRFDTPGFVDPVAVGDRVEVSVRGDEALILSVEPRRNVLGRKAVGQERRQLLAANLDLAVLVLSAREPSWKPATLDRLLVLASAGGVDGLFCLNKIDLDPAAADDPDLEIYRRLGLPVAAVSARTGDGIPDLVASIASGTVVLLGPSGAGKTSLMNRLVPEADGPVGMVSAATGKGTHTTTWVEMIDLPGGGHLIDSPGLRVLDLTGVEPEDLVLHFPEMKTLVGSCRFPDCLHRAEPGCAIKDAVATGTIAPSRYDSYLRILDSLERGGG